MVIKQPEVYEIDAGRVGILSIYGHSDGKIKIMYDGGHVIIEKDMFKEFKEVIAKI